jgi:hypothetical protein
VANSLIEKESISCCSRSSPKLRDWPLLMI